MDTLISIIAPVYKVEKYLKVCIDSILNQTFKQFELILVDDGSPDSCPQICDDYAQLDSRIKVIHKKNGGVSDARNAGLSAATGKYIGFVDSDDYIAPDMFSILYEDITKNDADIAICGAYNVGEDDTKQYITDSGSVNVYRGDDILYALFNKKIDIHPWRKLYKRELFENIKYPVGKIYEDLLTAYKLYDISDTVILNDTKKYFYRIRQDSCMGTNKTSIKPEEMEAFNDMLTYFSGRPEILKPLKLYIYNFIAPHIFLIVTNKKIKENMSYFLDLRKIIKRIGITLQKSFIVCLIGAYCPSVLSLRSSILSLISGR